MLLAPCRDRQILYFANNAMIHRQSSLPAGVQCIPQVRREHKFKADACKDIPDEPSSQRRVLPLCSRIHVYLVTGARSRNRGTKVGIKG
jgi:hypothetical protein